MSRSPALDHPPLEIFRSLAAAIAAGYEFYDEGSGGYLVNAKDGDDSFALVFETPD
jgi:hypothetical protein